MYLRKRLALSNEYNTRMIKNKLTLYTIVSFDTKIPNQQLLQGSFPKLCFRSSPSETLYPFRASTNIKVALCSIYFFYTIFFFFSFQRLDPFSLSAFGMSQKSLKTGLETSSRLSKHSIFAESSESVVLKSNGKNKNKTVHRTLSRTPSGKIPVEDLKNIYSCMLSSLNLHSSNKSGKFGFISHLKKRYSFCFTAEKGIKALQDLSYDRTHSKVYTNVTYTISQQSAEELLNTFFEAHLLHSPTEKTRTHVCSKRNILQPTPKGVAVLQRFRKQNGNASSISELLKSDINTMELVCFDRNNSTDHILYNKCWDQLLFSQVMGTRMNFWSPNNPPDEVPQEVLNTRWLLQTEQSPDKFTFEGSNQIPQTKQISSPFFHRFFTNPDSDSHIQYYVSNKGVRLFRNKIVQNEEDKDINLPYCVTGKALVQYLLDCTDVMYLHEANMIGQIFLDLKFLKSAIGDNSDFHGKKTEYYVVGSEGSRLVGWKKVNRGSRSSINTEFSSFKSINTYEELEDEKIKPITLDDVLHDPALKYLFRQYLTQTFCEENLDAYAAMIDFDNSMKLLDKIVKLDAREKSRQMYSSKSSNEQIGGKRNAIKGAINKVSRDCLSKVYTIYGLYIVSGASNELNISSELKEKFRLVMDAPETPKLPSGFDTENSTSTSSDEETEACHWLKVFESNEKFELINYNGTEQESKDEVLHQRPPKIALAKKPENIVSEMSPDTFKALPGYKILLKMSDLLNQACEEVFEMMNKDSMPKFVESEAYRDSQRQLHEIKQ